MAFTPISNTVPQYEENGVAASGYFIKFYESGTTTPTAMATDSTGTTLLDKCELNTEGYPINGSSAVFIPHINKKYKIALFRNAADADANDLASAAWPAVDGLLPVLSEGDGQVDTIANLRLLKPSFDGQQVDILGHTLAGIGGGQFYYDPDDTTSADNDGTVIVTGSGNRWKRKLNGYITTSQFGAANDKTIDSLAAVTNLFSSDLDVKIIVDGAHLLSGTTGLLLTSKIDVEFVGDGAFYFDVADGTMQTDFITLENGTQGSRIINPRIIQENAAIRGTRPAINPRNTSDIKIINPFVKGTTGAGILSAASQYIKVIGGTVESTLADGYHITSGCVDVQYVAVTAKNTGDDGMAIVSTVSGGSETCQGCYIQGTSINSGARGAALIGGTDCRMDVISRNAAAKGVIVSRDATFDTYGVVNCIVNCVIDGSGEEGLLIQRLVDGLLVNAVVNNPTGRGVSLSGVLQPCENVTINATVTNGQSSGFNAERVVNLKGSVSISNCDDRGVFVGDSSDGFDLSIYAIDNCEVNALSQVFVNGSSNGSIGVTSLDSRGTPLILNALQLSGCSNVDVSRFTYNQSSGGLVNAPIGQDVTFPKREVKANQAMFEDITSFVNTKDIYIDGKQAWDETGNQPLWKNGVSSGSVWRDSAGVVVYTPA